eukprot:CAMPEP_0194480298 /NCGR_PEP_ID=MMETSP0253-20130528/3147_1 /TAXON_ID=2966 /ORGANISM="Noctiluca scintillans" /LENGTH=181 /DNA_ID=CAMNT_0039319659 /DNA_START=261 /DNA_END=808 /DNA_ORIENTATION=+
MEDDAAALTPPLGASAEGTCCLSSDPLALTPPLGGSELEGAPVHRRVRGALRVVLDDGDLMMRSSPFFPKGLRAGGGAKSAIDARRAASTHGRFVMGDWFPEHGDGEHTEPLKAAVPKFKLSRLGCDISTGIADWRRDGDDAGLMAAADFSVAVEAQDAKMPRWIHSVGAASVSVTGRGQA